VTVPKDATEQKIPTTDNKENGTVPKDALEQKTPTTDNGTSTLQNNDNTKPADPESMTKPLNGDS